MMIEKIKGDLVFMGKALIVCAFVGLLIVVLLGPAVVALRILNG